jgi:hypothetical protein
MRMDKKHGENQIGQILGNLVRAFQELERIVLKKEANVNEPFDL